MTPSVCFPSGGGSSTVAMRREASEMRKTLKPLMEKRRRARINDCLNQLKNLILPLMGKDNCRSSKLEKADILEMTVKFLAEPLKTPTRDAAVNYTEGYDACLQRVSALLPRTSLDREGRARVHAFVQQQQRRSSSPPSCRACSARALSANEPVPHERVLRALEVSRGAKRAGVTPEKVQDAAQVAAQHVWRPW
ncbi:hes family bHLH transcription factor 2, tandem duplicate 2, partial [Silurus asotus]